MNPSPASFLPHKISLAADNIVKSTGVLCMAYSLRVFNPLRNLQANVQVEFAILLLTLLFNFQDGELRNQEPSTGLWSGKNPGYLSHCWVVACKYRNIFTKKHTTINFAAYLPGLLLQIFWPIDIKKTRKQLFLFFYLSMIISITLSSPTLPNWHSYIFGWGRWYFAVYFARDSGMREGFINYIFHFFIRITGRCGRAVFIL